MEQAHDWTSMNYRWATKCPSQHLVGKQIGLVRVAVYAARRGGVRRFADVESGKADWIAPDDALPEHPSVLWRKRHFSRTYPRYRVNSILSVLELVALGLDVGIVPWLQVEGRSDVVRLTEGLDECVTETVVAHPSRVAASAPGCGGLFAFGSGG